MQPKIQIALSVVGYLLMFGALVALFAIKALFSPQPGVIIAQVAAVGLMVWARVTFGFRSFHLGANPTAGGLIKTGPYRFVRHPIYTAVFVFAMAGAVVHLTVQSAALVAGLLVGMVSRMLTEERLLTQRYSEYGQYASRTKRMIPFIF